VTIALETSKGLQRREQILAVARNLLVEEGYNRFVLREIAARSGMAIGNLQYYFRARELLLGVV
jgi:AcrR family transcriptional regulator